MRSFCLLASLALSVSASEGQCRFWNLDLSDGIPGVDGSISSMIAWDPDGPGPRPEVLVVGGQFQNAGTVTANGIAQFDGSEWHPFETELFHNAGQSVYELAVYNGELYAGGSFTRAGGAPSDGLAKWDGHVWRPVADLAHPDGAWVSKMLVHEGGLVFCGQFRSINGAAAANFGIHNENGVSPLGTVALRVTDLCVHNGELIASAVGQMPGWRWDGAAWQAMGVGVDINTTSSICSHEGELFAGSSGHVPGFDVPHVRRWDGAAWPVVAGWGMSARNMTSVDGGMWAALSSGTTARRGAMGQWTGSGWRASETLEESASRIAKFRDQWYVAGRFSATESYGTQLAGIGRLGTDGFSIEAVCAGRQLTPQFLAANDRGEFAVGSPQIVHGDRPERFGLHVRDGSGWRSLGPPTIAILGGIVWFEGTWVHRGNERWDGSAWTSFSSNVYLRQMAVLDGTLYGAGSVISEAGAWSQRVVRWNGASWDVLGGVFSAPASAVGVWRGRVVAGGGFTSIGGVPARGLAVWDGQTWSELGGGVSGWVGAMAVFGDELIVGGEFGAAGGEPVQTLAIFDGSTWRGAGAGLGGSGGEVPQVRALAAVDGALYVGGQFSRAGDRPATGLAVWDGARWESDGLDLAWRYGAPRVNTIAVSGSTVALTGDFDHAGGRPVGRFARLDTLRPACIGDFDCSGGVDGADVEAFFLAWERGGLRADLNADGGVDNADVAAFFAVWEGGC